MNRRRQDHGNSHDCSQHFHRDLSVGGDRMHLHTITSRRLAEDASRPCRNLDETSIPWSRNTTINIDWFWPFLTSARAKSRSLSVDRREDNLADSSAACRASEAQPAWR